MNKLQTLVAVCTCAAGAFMPLGAQGTPFRAGTTVFDLGSGREATRTVTYVFRAPVRVTWSTTGFVPPGEQVLAYASVAGGRLVALTSSNGIQYSDDGQRWHVARIDGRPLSQPSAAAFSTALGAIVSEVSGVWVTRDRGENWRQIRDRTPRALDDVAVVGTQIVYTDDRGGVWLVDGASSVFRTLCESGLSNAATLVAESNERILARGREGCAWRIDASGATIADGFAP